MTSLAASVAETGTAGGLWPEELRSEVSVGDRGGSGEGVMVKATEADTS
jgi:hypothetical protein